MDKHNSNIINGGGLKVLKSTVLRLTTKKRWDFNIFTITNII